MPSKPDVLIVGSGPLGTAAARKLSEHGLNVLILEQGPAITDPPGCHTRNATRFHTDPDAYLGVATAHLKFFDNSVPRDQLPGAAVTAVRGGQGVIWTNLCPRGDAPWDALSPADWSAYYDQAESYLGVHAAPFDSSVRQQRIKEKLGRTLALDGRTIETLPVAARFEADGSLYFTGPYDILAAAESATRRVRVVEATADRLIHRGGRVTGVSLGNETIEAPQVIVAGGAIGTPQLLHRSGIRPKALGRWLSYHPLMVAQLVLDGDLCAPPGEADREPRLQIPPSEKAEWFSLVLRDVSPFSPKAPDVDVDANRLVEVQGLCPVDIVEENGIRFDDESRPTFEVPLSAADQARLDGAKQDADRIAKALGRYRAGCEPIWMPFGFAHMTGTTRMSAFDDGTGVADYKGRVWGFDNLRLATNGLIPTRMAVNPTLTGTALSIAIAEGLLVG
ncbi:MAG: FAD-dependent oxidoreductase [Hyphomicrobium sp.]